MFEFLLMSTQAVVAEPSAPDGAVTRFDRAFFKDSQPTNAFDMLQRVPGFTLDAGGGVRGFDGGAGNVLIDGMRPASKTEGLEEMLKRISVSRIAWVDLIRGGAPGINMQGRDLIANLILETSAAPSIVVQAREKVLYDGRALPGVRVDANGSGGTSKWEVSARYDQYEDNWLGWGPQRRVGPDGKLLYEGALDGFGADEQYALTGAYETSLGKGQVRVNARRFREDWDADDDLRVKGAAARTEQNRSKSRRFDGEWGARVNYPLTDRLDGEVIGIWQTMRQARSSRFETTGRSDLFQQGRRTREAIVRSGLTWRPSETVTLETALEAADNRLNSATEMLKSGVKIDLPAASVSVAERRYQALARAAWRWGDVQFDASVRRETSTLEASAPALGKSLAYTKPKLSVSWSVAPGFTLRGRYERVVGQINFDDFVAVSRGGDGAASAGNPNLEPGQAYVKEVTLEKAFWGSGALSVTLRTSRLEDVVDRAPTRTPTGVFDAPSNIGDGKRDIALVALTLPLDRLGVTGGLLKGDWTVSRSRVIDPTTGQGRGISGVRPQTWSATFTQDLPARRATWGVNFYGDWQETWYRFNEIETAKLQTFVKPFVEWRQRPDLTWRLEYLNITERPMRRSRTVFNGARDVGSLAYTDSRSAHFGQSIFVMARKTLG